MDLHDCQVNNSYNNAGVMSWASTKLFWNSISLNISLGMCICVCVEMILLYKIYNQFSLVQSLSCVRLFETPWLHTRLSGPSPAPWVCSNSCPLCQWCHPTILSSIVPFSSCLKSFPASGSFPMSQVFISGGQSIGVSASTSVLPMNTQDRSPSEWTGWISL